MLVKSVPAYQPDPNEKEEVNIEFNEITKTHLAAKGIDAEWDCEAYRSKRMTEDFGSMYKKKGDPSNLNNNGIQKYSW